jgi:hypothetical protein
VIIASRTFSDTPVIFPDLSLLPPPARPDDYAM